MRNSSRALRLEPGSAARDAALAAVAFVVVVGLLRISEVVGGIAAFVALAVFSRRRPGWFLALVLVGSYVYLGALELGGQAPRSLVTAIYDAVLGVLLLAFAWPRRERIFTRLRCWSARIWVGAALILGGWFAVSVALLQHGPNARRFAGLLVFLSGPAVLAALAAERQILEEVRRGLIALGLIVAAVSYLALALGRSPEGGRFIPIAHYDPISPAIVVLLGLVAALAGLPASRRDRLRLGAVVAVLGSTFVIYGTRGPVVAGAVAALVVTVVAGRRILSFAIPSLAIALIGAAFVSQLGSFGYYTTQFGRVLPAGTPTATQSSQGSGSPGAARGEPANLPPAISSISMRRDWVHDAFAQFPDKPVFGHGVTMLVDDAPDSKRLGTAGELIWPHNDFAEAAHALGLLGLVPFLLVVGVPFVALVRLRRAPDRRRLCFLAGLFVFAFAESNFSGEIGGDALLWASAAFLVADWADTTAT